MRNNLELMLIEASSISKNDIIIITGYEPYLFPNINIGLLRKILKSISLAISHIDLGIKISKSKDKDAIVIYGFSTEFLFLTFLFSFFWTTNVYLLNHHNLQQAYVNPFMNFLLKICDSLKYKFIILETVLVMEDLGYKKEDLERHISLPHSVVKNVRKVADPNLFSDEEIKKKKVSIIGQSRQGKKFSDTLELMIDISHKLDILLIIGTDDFSCFDGMNLLGVKLIDTSTNDAYMSALSACDVVVLNYEKSAYFYRCSGVAADAIGVRTYVVCPDFPFMSSQVDFLAKVGIVYKNENDLEDSLRKALELTSISDNPAFESHYIERSITKNMSILDKAIQANP